MGFWVVVVCLVAVRTHGCQFVGISRRSIVVGYSFWMPSTDI